MTHLQTYQKAGIGVFLLFCSLTAGAYIGGIFFGTAAGKDAPFSIESPVISAGGYIPSRYACDGKNVSPPFSLKNVPDGTKSFAILVDDPDATTAVGPWGHWIVWNIPPDTVTFPEGYLPAGAVEGTNDFRGIGYYGPCPMEGLHAYRFVVYALDEGALDELSPSARREDAVKVFRRHAIEKALLTASYSRQ